MMGGDIWVMPALGGTPRRISPQTQYPLVVPDDGTKIVFVRTRIGLFEVACPWAETCVAILRRRAIRRLYCSYPVLLIGRPMGLLLEDSRNNISAVAGDRRNWFNTSESGRHPAWDRVVSLGHLQRQPRRP